MGAPGSPKRTWAKNDIFRLLLADRLRKSFGGASPARPSSSYEVLLKHRLRRDAIPSECRA